MIQSISLIGAGNLATRLGIALKEAGLTIAQVYSRTEESAQALATKLGAEYTNELEAVNTEVDLLVFALKDDSLETVLSRLNLQGKLIVHTAGSLPMSVLSDHSDRYGIFYPLQTFSKQREVNFQELPFCLEASNDEIYADLEQLAQRISTKVFPIDSAQRQSLHLAAVFVCNFVNHFYYLGEQVVDKYQVDFELLKPLIMETAAKVMELKPYDAQTGPAKRYDEAVINKHLHFLEDQPDLQKIYSFVSKQIFEAHKKE